MGTIKFACPEEVPATVAADAVGDVEREVLPPDAWSSYVRMYHPGSETELQMVEVSVAPDTVSGQHAHAEAEIVYVLEGQMVFGSRVLNSGASAYIPGNTLYEFRTGPDGVRFLNFRAAQDLTYISKEQFLAGRAGSGG
jgi:quercetin dioxygenase-like cupin family protein